MKFISGSEWCLAENKGYLLSKYISDNLKNKIQDKIKELDIKYPSIIDKDGFNVESSEHKRLFQEFISSILIYSPEKDGYYIKEIKD